MNITPEQLDEEVDAIIALYGADTECVLMGPNGGTDIMSAAELCQYAADHYDDFDYHELHACTVEQYVAAAKEVEEWFLEYREKQRLAAEEG